MTNESQTQTNAKTKTESRKPLWVYLKQFTAHLWLGIRALRPFGLGICALLAVWWIVFYFGYRENHIRLLGMVLQLVGFLFVAKGLRDSGALFEKLTVRESMALYFKSFPRRSVTNHIISAQGISASASFGSGRISVLPGPNTPLEKRVEMLEERTANLFSAVGELEGKLRAQSDELTLRITEERTEREAEHKAFGKKLERAVVGGIHAEWLGLIFFIVGIFLASASPELCGLLGNTGNCG